MGVWRSLAGSVRIRVTSADVPGAFRLLTDKNILLQDITYESDLCISATIHRNDYNRTEHLLVARGDRCEPAKRWGIYWTFRQMRSRPVFLIGIAMLVVLTVFIPSKVFFIQVQGNDSVPSGRIIEIAQDIGLSFGSERADIQSEQMKNELLEALPELEWVGITTAGCVANIEVKEKFLEEENSEMQFPVSSLVASCDGVVESITVTNGTPLCRPGQAVWRGQVLISGYEDLGLVIKASNAEGEIYAKTYRYLQSVTPSISDVRTAYKQTQTNFSVQIGKKQINFFQDSGISPTGCVKMYSKNYLTLPGGFQLPVALITEKVYYCDTQPRSAEEVSFFWMEAFSDQYVRGQMLAGEVIRKDITSELLDDICVLSAEYACREQIGQKRNEESLNHNGENS